MLFMYVCMLCCMEMARRSRFLIFEMFSKRFQFLFWTLFMSIFLEEYSFSHFCFVSEMFPVFISIQHSMYVCLYLRVDQEEDWTGLHLVSVSTQTLIYRYTHRSSSPTIFSS